jgi:hypothetical protein
MTESPWEQGDLFAPKTKEPDAEKPADIICIWCCSMLPGTAGMPYPKLRDTIEKHAEACLCSPLHYALKREKIAATRLKDSEKLLGELCDAYFGKPVTHEQRAALYARAAAFLGRKES